MIHLLAFMMLVQVPDTVTMSSAEALERARTTSPIVEAARERARAAGSRVRQARILTNPTVSATAENLGAAVETTGRPAWEGTEGQILLGMRIPLGGDRGAAIRRSEAYAEEAAARLSATELDVGMETVDGIAQWVHDRALSDHAERAAAGLQRLAEDVARQADLGRASDGDAARLRLASASAWARVASARAELARSEAGLSRLLQVEPGAALVVTLPTCTWEEPSAASDVLPDLQVMESRTRGWEAVGSELRAGAIPDVNAQVGWRRSAGFDAVYVGLEFELPFFDRRQGAREAARAEALASEADRAAVSAGLASERAAARESLEALREAGVRFDDEWNRALTRSVESSEARYALGEGTLTELLDGRRAWLDALAAFEAWRLDLFRSRARLARTSGHPFSDGILCDPSPIPEPTP